MKVSDVMLKEYPAVDKDETLEHAMRVMERYDLDRVVVFEKHRLVGIMTKKDVMMKLGTLRARTTTPGRLHVSGFMTPDPITVSPDAELAEPIKIMVEKKIGSLPVVRGDEVVGLLTRWEAVKPAEQLSSVRVADVMVPIPEPLKPGNKVLHARQLLLRYDAIFLPVLNDDGKPVGYITIDEVADAFFAVHELVPMRYRKDRVEHLLVDDIMRLKPPTVELDDTLPTVLEKMRQRRSKGVVVVRGERAVGMVTLNEVLKYLALRSS